MSELSNEELAMRIAAGEKNLTLQLWKQIENFVKAQAIKYYVCCDIDGTASFEVDDLIQEAYFALIQAIEYFPKTDGQCKFSTYFSRCLRGKFCEVRKGRYASQMNDAFRNSKSLDVFISDDSDETFLDMLESDENVEEVVTNSIYNQSLHAAVELALKHLSEQEEKVIRGIYYDGFSANELARIKKCTKQSILYIKNKALEKLYNERNENGLGNFLEEHTNYHQTVSLQYFKNTGISSVEKIVLKREALTNKYLKKHFKALKGTGNEKTDK